MAYVDAAGTNRAQAVIGVAAIHAALAVVVVTGLAGGVATIIPRDIMNSFDVPIPKPKTPPPPPDQPVDQEIRSQTKVVIPETRFDFEQSDNRVDSTDQQQDYTRPDETASGNEGVGDGLGDNGGGKAQELPKFKPVPPVARNGNWVTDNDYRSSWVTRKWEGTAGFRLTVGTDGRVKDCTITQSTGHDALDDATCALVKKRAKFDPAKNDRGETANGTFSSAVRWQIPD
jgi:protein TonB